MVEKWRSDRLDCLNQIEAQLGKAPYIVRSSSGLEDRATASSAGAFRTLLNVKTEQLEKSIDEVVASYGKVNLADEILVQPMLENVVRSGVAFSHDPSTGEPYRSINWANGDDTTIVTGGKGGHLWQTAASHILPKTSMHAPIISLLDELLDLFGRLPVDCEFAVTKQSKMNQVWLLQARPLVLSCPPQSEKRQFERLLTIKNKVVRGMRPHPFLMGSRTIYGVMPDWNPAEIIGLRPKPLALSLYRELITDSIWAYQRNNYGYRDLRSFPLMPNFLGLPYIDVRVSFNSFIPADLDADIGGRLVDYYIEKLESEPKLHDKVEFEIIWSCFTLDLNKKLEVLDNHGFTRQEQRRIADSLRRITNAILNPQDGLHKQDSKKIMRLQQRHRTLFASDLEPTEKIYWLIEDVKRYGTLPFAGLARAGFIAIQILQSLVNLNIFSVSDYDNFLASISTVSGQMKRDRVSMAQSEFLDIYGHLRPGTYDILSPRYDEAPQNYFDWDINPSKPSQEKPFTPTSEQLNQIDERLSSNGIKSDAHELMTFLKSAIELRESAKFQFTRNLSDAMSLIAKVGADNGFGVDDIAFCNFEIFQELQVSEMAPEKLLKKSIEEGKRRYSDTLKVTLPPLITRPTDVLSFMWPDMAPNFITQNQVTAHVVSSDCRDQLKGAIVCIKNADPGYDWLFSFGIAGLITAWGGANSHMAIRAAEQGLPAIIGAGEILYSRWSGASALKIDCASHRVEILS